MATDERRPSGRPSGQSRSNSGSHQGNPNRRPGDAPRRPASADGRRPQSEGRPSHPEGRRPQPEGRPRQSELRQRPDNSRRQAPARSSRPQKEKKGMGLVPKIILITLEVCVLLGLVFILWKFVIPATDSGKVELPEEDIIINAEVKEKIESVSETGEEPAMVRYRNIALFGVDSREGALTKNTRSDTIMIASIDMETGECKLVSVFRDTYLNLGNDSYNKCNAAYAKGGPMQAINMLNMNLDMNITDFITIGFNGLTDVIDALGGVEINVTEAEISHLNNYQISMVGKTSDGETFTATEGVDYKAVTSPGLQTLNGLQATAYCRIRYVGNDFQRAERQRTVIKAIMDKAKANPTKLAGIAENVFSEVYTSLDLSEIIEILGKITEYKIVDEAGFPDETMRGGGNIGSKGSCVVPLSLYDNVIWLHKFLFDEDDYVPSSAVKEYSDKILSDTAPYI